MFVPLEVVQDAPGAGQRQVDFWLEQQNVIARMLLQAKKDHRLERIVRHNHKAGHLDQRQLARRASSGDFIQQIFTLTMSHNLVEASIFSFIILADAFMTKRYSLYV